MRISDWSSDVCSSDLHRLQEAPPSQLSPPQRASPAAHDPEDRCDRRGEEGEEGRAEEGRGRSRGRRTRHRLSETRRGVTNHSTSENRRCVTQWPHIRRTPPRRYPIWRTGWHRPNTSATEP